MLLLALVLLAWGICPLTPPPVPDQTATARASDAEFATLHAQASLALERLRQSHE